MGLRFQAARAAADDRRGDGARRARPVASRHARRPPRRRGRLAQAGGPGMNRIPPPRTNDGSDDPPKLLVYGNGWGLLELPTLPREQSWTFEERLDHLVDAKFAGLQADT